MRFEELRLALRGCSEDIRRPGTSTSDLLTHAAEAIESLESEVVRLKARLLRYELADSQKPRF